MAGSTRKQKRLGYFVLSPPCSIFIQISSGCRRPIIDTASTRFVYQMAVGPRLGGARLELSRGPSDAKCGQVAVLVISAFSHR